MKYTFAWWHAAVAAAAVFIVWLACSMYQNAKREIEFRKRFRQEFDLKDRSL